RIKKAQKERGVIVFTDPDFPGEKIRKIISRAVPGVKHAFLKRDEARPTHKGSLGIEHASPDVIRKSLEEVYTETGYSPAEQIRRSFLVEMGLVDGPASKERRRLLGEKLRIGYTNGKQLKKRMEMFNISEQEVREALTTAMEEEHE